MSETDPTDDSSDGFELTTEQQQALDLDRNIAITAGAGTGKTTTLTQRYLSILETDETLTPENIATITFTKDAANEMQDRIRDKVAAKLDAADTPAAYHRWQSVKDDLEDGYVHTIHAFCSRLLHEYAVAAPVPPKFETLDETESKTLMQDVVIEFLDDEVGTDGDLQQLARLYSRAGLEQILVGLLDSRPLSTEWAERWHDKTPAEYLEFAVSQFHPIDSETAVAAFDDPAVPGAVTTLRAIRAERPAVPVDDSGWELLTDLLDIIEETSALQTDQAANKQQALNDIANRLTTNAGTIYSRDHNYRGSKANWSGHEDLQSELLDAVNTLIDAFDPESLDYVSDLTIEENSAPYVLALARVYRRVAQRYADELARQNALDFYGQVERAIEFLKHNDDARHELQSQFEYLMVDEVQDTDPRQWELVQLLAADEAAQPDSENGVLDPNDHELVTDKVFLVGDEKQSIYRFRGADVTSFRDARHGLERANESERPAAGSLSGSFRTTGETLHFLNDLFQRIFEPMADVRQPYEAAPQDLTFDRPHGRDVTGEVEYLLVPKDDHPEIDLDGHPLESRTFTETADREGQALATRLTQLFADPPDIYDDDAEVVRPAKPSDVALLLRARTRLDSYLRAFDEYDIPYSVISGKGFYETPEITALLNLFRVLEDPTDDIALYGVLRSPLFGYTDEELAPVAAESDQLWNGLESSGGQLGETFALLSDWRTRAGCGADLPADGITKLAALVTDIIDETGYLASVGADERPQQAVANVQKFREQIRQWEEGGTMTVSTLLTRIDQQRSQDSKVGEATVDGEVEGVQIRTIHSAKGLEFPIVIVPEVGVGFNLGGNVDEWGKLYLDRVNEGVDPVLGLSAPSSDDPFETKQTFARKAVRDAVTKQDLAEQKRLLYVAMTRARDHLLLSGTHPFDSSSEEPQLKDPKDPADARTWRDWLQPILFGEQDVAEAKGDGDQSLLEELVATGSCERTFERGSCHLTLPPLPHADWRGTSDPKTTTFEDLSPSPPTAARAATVSATNYAKAATGTTTDDALWEAERAHDGDTDDDSTADEAEDEATDTETFEARHFGELVHRLCEWRDPEDQWDGLLTNWAAELDVEPTDDDREEIKAHARIGIESVERLRSETPGIQIGRYDELFVTSRFGPDRLIGYIDHLVVTDDAYHIIDYKTSDTARRSVDELSERYWPQLEVYAAALHQNDSSKRVFTSLVFTDADEITSRELDVETTAERIESTYADLLDAEALP